MQLPCHVLFAKKRLDLGIVTLFLLLGISRNQLLGGVEDGTLLLSISWSC